MSDPKTTRAILTAPVETDQVPSGVPFIVANEAAERFSFYGMRGILVAFMTKFLLDSAGNPAPLSDADATAVFHYFVAGVYFFPIFGALLADGLLGKYRTIIGLSLVYCVGHAILALMDLPQLTGLQPKYALYAGLVLVAIGAGGIKPCVSAHVGDQFGRANAHLLSRVFGWFYLSINVGALISSLLTPWLLNHPDYGPAWAFGVPGVLMALATLAFWLGRYRYAHIPADFVGLQNSLSNGSGWESIGKLLPVFGFIIAFWMLFDQTGSAWVLQAERMNGSLAFLGLDTELLPSQLQFANPALVLLLIPLFSYVVYPFVSRFVAVTPLRKIGLGIVLAGAAFAISGLLERAITAAEATGEPVPHRLWQLVPYLVLTAAEVLVSITSLEFSYTQAPRQMKSIVMGLYFLSITVANLIVAEVNSWIGAVRVGNPEAGTAPKPDFLQGSDYYDVFAIAAVAAAVGFIVWSRSYRYETVLQSDDAPPERAGGPADPVDRTADGGA